MRTANVHLTSSWQQIRPDFWVRQHPGTELSGDISLMQEKGTKFAAVEVTDTTITLHADFIRSWPLVYAVTDDEVVVSDSAFPVAEKIGARVDPLKAEEFLHIGYCLGETTLFPGVSHVPAGHSVEISLTSGTVRSIPRDVLEFTDVRPLTRPELRASVADYIRRSVDFLIQRANGATIAVPLSGGIDSRILISAMKESGYDNFLAFTYGLPNSSEARTSKAIAESLDVPWYKAEFTTESLAREWKEHGDEAFLRAASSGIALPHIQDWYALHAMRRDRVLEPGSIITPGHTIVGCTRTGTLSPEAGITAAQVKSLFARSHFTLKSAPKEALTLPTVQASLDQFLGQFPHPRTWREFASLQSRFWHEERETKYISNSVHVYEHFGFDWDMPLHCRDLRSFYCTATDTAVNSRVWYTDIADDFYIPLATHAPQVPVPRDSIYTPSRPRKWAAAAVRESGLGELIARRGRVKNLMPHPLGFDALLPEEDRLRFQAHLKQGATPTGLFAQAFLEDRWVKDSHLFS